MGAACDAISVISAGLSGWVAGSVVTARDRLRQCGAVVCARNGGMVARARK